MNTKDTILKAIIQITLFKWTSLSIYHMAVVSKFKQYFQKI
jgi:hypothetical protein